MENTQYKALVTDNLNDEYYWEVSLAEDFLVIKYVEEGRTLKPADETLINFSAAEPLAKAILKLLELHKYK